MHSLPKEENIAKSSFRALLLTGLGIVLFGIYVGILIYGENSLTVLDNLKEKKALLKVEGKALKNKNQKLQKTYFELKQLVPKVLNEGAI